jgi:cobalt-zinc-cadmium resistance protein CzcA
MIESTTAGDRNNRLSYRSGIYLQRGQFRYIGVGFNIEGRDLGSTIADAKKQIEKDVKLPKSYKVVWAGEFESKERATKQLMNVVPISLILILLLYATLGNVKDTLISSLTWHLHL